MTRRWATDKRIPKCSKGKRVLVVGITGYNTYLKEMMGERFGAGERKRREVKWEDEDEDSQVR